MTLRDEGLLVAAAEARRRGQDARFEAAAAEVKNHLQRRRRLLDDAHEWEEFAEWCESAANTYPGASRVVIWV